MSKKDLPEWKEPKDVIEILKTFELMDMPKDETIAKRFYFPRDLEKKSCLVEFRFYENSFVIYKEYYRAGQKDIRKVYDEILYSSIEDMMFRKELGNLLIFGKEEIVWYRYLPNGKLSKFPDYHKIFENGVFRISLEEKEQEKVFKMLEKYTLKKVRVE